MMLMRRLSGLSGCLGSSSLLAARPDHAQHALLGHTKAPFRGARHWPGRPTAPSCYSPVAAREGLGIGVAFQRQAVGHLGQHLAQFAQQVAHMGLHHGAAAVEHGAVAFIHDLDAQAFLGHVELDLATQGGDLGVGGDDVLDLGLELLPGAPFGPALLFLELGLEVVAALLGLDLAGLDLAGFPVRSLPPPLTTLDASPAPLPPSMATLSGDWK